MLKVYVKATDLIDRLRNDKAGVVSFEYIIVAALVIAAVGAAFASTGTNTIGGALTAGLTKLSASLTTAM